MACHRCGCRIVTKAKLHELGLICADCGNPVVELQSNQGLVNWLSRISVVLFLLVLAGLPAMVGSRVSSDTGSKPSAEHAGRE
jgi:DNA-directed RNA polymerase subunit RPC12/RpoP